MAEEENQLPRTKMSDSDAEQAMSIYKAILAERDATRPRMEQVFAELRSPTRPMEIDGTHRLPAKTFEAEIGKMQREPLDPRVATDGAHQVPAQAIDPQAEFDRIGRKFLDTKESKTLQEFTVSLNEITATVNSLNAQIEMSYRTPTDPSVGLGIQPPSGPSLGLFIELDQRYQAQLALIAAHQAVAKELETQGRPRLAQLLTEWQRNVEEVDNKLKQIILARQKSDQQNVATVIRNQQEMAPLIASLTDLSKYR